MADKKKISVLEVIEKHLGVCSIDNCNLVLSVVRTEGKFQLAAVCPKCGKVY